MKEILEKIGLSEFFAYVCPGAILFSSFILWIEPQKIVHFLGEQIVVKLAFITGFFILIFSYTLGLIVALWSSRGANLYLRWKGKVQLRKRKAIVSRLLAWLLWIPHGLPEPRSNRSIVAAKLKIATDFRYSGLRNLSLIQVPWDWLALYRTIMVGQVGEQDKPILTEADSVHRRFLFSQGVALAFFLLAVQSLVRLLLFLLHTDSLLPCIGPHWFVVIILIGTLVSAGLRITAGRWWEYEQVLTFSLTQIEQQERKP